MISVDPRQSGIGMAEEGKESWQGNLQKPDEVGRWATKQDEYRSLIEKTEPHRFPWPDADPVESLVPSPMVKDPGHQVAVSGP